MNKRKADNHQKRIRERRIKKTQLYKKTYIKGRKLWKYKRKK